MCLKKFGSLFFSFHTHLTNEWRGKQHQDMNTLFEKKTRQKSHFTSRIIFRGTIFLDPYLRIGRRQKAGKSFHFLDWMWVNKTFQLRRLWRGVCIALQFYVISGCSSWVQSLFLVSGSVVQKQYAFRGNKYGSDGGSVQQAHTHLELHSIGNGLWKLLLCGGKFLGNLQVSLLLF